MGDWSDMNDIPGRSRNITSYKSINNKQEYYFFIKEERGQYRAASRLYNIGHYIAFSTTACEYWNWGVQRWMAFYTVYALLPDREQCCTFYILRDITCVPSI